MSGSPKEDNTDIERPTFLVATLGVWTSKELRIFPVEISLEPEYVAGYESTLPEFEWYAGVVNSDAITRDDGQQLLNERQELIDKVAQSFGVESKVVAQHLREIGLL